MGEFATHARTRVNALIGASAVVTVVALLGATAVAVTPSGRQVFGLVYEQPVVKYNPCLMSISGPASADQGCTPWTRRETAAPWFHPDFKVIVMGGADGRLRAYQYQNGAQVYEVDVNGSLVTRPTFAGSKMVFGTTNGFVVQADVTSGRERWETKVDAEVTEPVVVDGDVVYAVTGLDSLYALDKKTGQILWQNVHPLPRGISLRGQSLPLVTLIKDDGKWQRRVYIGHASGILEALDPASGNPIARVDLARSEAFNDIDADPVMQAGNLIVAAHGAGLMSLDPATLTINWTIEEKGLVRLAPAGESMVVAAGNKTIIAVHVPSGQIRWRFTWERGAPTRIFVHGGRVHFGSDRGALYVLDLFTGRPLQYHGSGIGVAADPQVVGDLLLYASTAGHLYVMSSAFAGPQQKRAK